MGKSICMRKLIVVAGVFLLLSTGCVADQTHPTAGADSAPVLQPNIIHILTDDMGWQDVACYYRAMHDDEPVYETPNIDRMAQNGMRFMQAYSPAPTCAPSRAAYMAGQYPAHTGVLHVYGGRLARPWSQNHSSIDPFYASRLPMDRPIIADQLKEAGYLTAHIQKWHLGGRSNGYPTPLDYGFDFSWGQGPVYNDAELWDPKNKKTADFEGLWRPMRGDRLSGFASSYDPLAPYALDPNDDDRPYDSVVDLSIRWMDKVKGQGKPFFMNYCPSFVHGPVCTRDRKRLEYYCKKMGVPFPADPGKIAELNSGQSNPYYAAMVDSVDWQVGKLMAFLESTDDPRNPGHKLIDNTYIMVSADNGGLERHPVSRGKGKGSVEGVTDNSPLSGGKHEIKEGGIRVPFIIQGPGIAQGRVSEMPINLIDMYPTYMAMAGIKPKPELELDGCNVLPVMLDQADVAKFMDGNVRESMFFHVPVVMPAAGAVRKGGWKLRLNYSPEMRGNVDVELYQLYNDDGSVCDLGETKNLADSNPEKREELLGELQAFLKKTDAAMPYKNAHMTGDEQLPGAEKVPAVLELLSEKDRVFVRFESGQGKAAVVEAKLLYTTNGSELLRDKSFYEEWFEVPATIADGIATAIAPPGMTHGVFYLRDENNFLITSVAVPSYSGAGANARYVGSEGLKDGYNYRPGLISLINTAVAAESNAKKTRQNVAALDTAIQAAQAVAQTPVEEKPYALAMRNLRKEIRALDVPEAKLPVMNQFKTEKWQGIPSVK